MMRFASLTTSYDSQRPCHTQLTKSCTKPSLLFTFHSYSFLPSLDIENAQTNRKQRTWPISHTSALIVSSRLLGCGMIRDLQRCAAAQRKLQDDEKANIYVGMRVNDFCILNAVCRRERSKSGIASAHFEATTASTGKMGDSVALNRARQTGGSAEISV